MKIATSFHKPNPAISPFLGIGEGKVRAAKAAAEIALEQSKNQTALTEAMTALAGYKAAAEKAAAETALIKAKSESTVAVTNADSGSNLYLIIGGIVITLMAGLYFIIKAR